MMEVRPIQSATRQQVAVGTDSFASPSASKPLRNFLPVLERPNPSQVQGHPVSAKSRDSTTNSRTRGAAVND